MEAQRQLESGREDYFQPRTPMGEIKMSSIKGSAHYTGLLPVVRPTALENDRFPNGQLSLRKRASRALSRFLIAFCTGVAASWAWWSYGDTAREMIANSYPQLRWLAPQAEPVAESAPNMIALAAPATPFFDQQQLSAMSLNLDAVRQSIDRIAAGQEQIMRSIYQIASSTTAGQEQIMRSIDQIASGIAAGQEQGMRSTDQTAASIGQAPSAKASGVTVESRDDAARLNIKSTEAKPPEKQLSAASAQDVSCFPSASAVLQNHPGVRPSWTMKARGHEGTVCWYAAAPPGGSDHRREMVPKETGTFGTTENALSASPPPHSRAPE
jgi:hypothetical protein